MTDYVTSTPNGVQLDLSSLEQTFTYDGQFPATITVTFNGIDYVQTFTNDGTNITSISQWVAQP